MLTQAPASRAAWASSRVSSPGTRTELSEYRFQSFRPSSWRAPTVNPKVIP